jgi:hypothetical protein
MGLFILAFLVSMIFTLGLYTLINWLDSRDDNNYIDRRDKDGE